MTPLVLTAAPYLGLGGLLLLVLTWRVIAIRRRERIGLGDGGNALLQRRIRAHANCSETLPMQLLLLLALELAGAGPWWLHGCGIAILAGRLLHAIGLSSRSGVSFGRFVGTLLSLLVTAVMAVWLCVTALLA